MNNERKLQSGFSLLEAIIASAIFSAVLIIASSAFKFYMSAGSRTVNSENIVKETMLAIKIRDSIKEIQHYYLKLNTLSSDDPVLFFKGAENGFTGISANSINYPEQSTKIALFKSQDADGYYSLIYCEFDNKTTYPTLDVASQCQQPIIWIEKLKEISFTYFGFKSLESLYNTSAYFGEEQNVKKEWSVNWDGSLRNVLPQFVQINITYPDDETGYYAEQIWLKIPDTDPLQIKVNNQSDG